MENQFDGLELSGWQVKVNLASSELVKTLKQTGNEGFIMAMMMMVAVLSWTIMSAPTRQPAD